MSSFDLRLSIENLAERVLQDKSFLAEEAARSQFNAFLTKAKEVYPDHLGITALPSVSMGVVEQTAFLRSINHLLDATKFLGQQSIMSCPKFKAVRAEAQLALDFQKATSSGRPVGLLFFDIDKFKDLNTTYVETVVDTYVLTPFTTFLADFVQDRGYVYRVGGDEFIAVLVNADASETEAFAKRLLTEAAERRYAVNGNEVKFTLSIGTCCSQPGNLTVDAVRRNANQAENTAKAAGRNRVVRF